MSNTERIVNAERVEDLITVFGSFDENIKRIEEALGVSIINRGTELKVTGDPEAADLQPGEGGGKGPEAQRQSGNDQQKPEGQKAPPFAVRMLISLTKSSI